MVERPRRADQTRNFVLKARKPCPTERLGARSHRRLQACDFFTLAGCECGLDHCGPLRRPSLLPLPRGSSR
ncbi:hypothetical protein DPMN_173582 [Dreissena polymorpha]|uniref:Uncharacterized protein n=1 Tax=Dreissena polymorpha TaxID=45954 RepID=A0A9D4E4W7_DREPO|nr:hypothetical protein DPMN_173582 [Dreissena polymorpha]